MFLFLSGAGIDYHDVLVKTTSRKEIFRKLIKIYLTDLLVAEEAFLADPTVI